MNNGNKISGLTLFRNWISLIGLLVAVGSFFAFVLLFVIDLLAPFSNPYMGLLTYFVAPGFLFFGIALILLGAWVERRAKAHMLPGGIPPLEIDLTKPRQQWMMLVFVCGAVIFLLATAVGSYKSYHFTESVEFCGLMCHKVMQPEYQAFIHGTHAKAGCSECHVGPGAEAFIRAKLAGTHQLLGVITGKYQRPVPAPVKNLRRADEICLECHSENRFVGVLDRTFTHYLADKDNTPYTVRLQLNVGGGDPTRGPVGGIHWHMNVANKIEYIATDDQRQVIPWVRVTDAKNNITEYKTADFKGDPSKYQIRRMDCVDCHNRVGHNLHSPSEALDLAMSRGAIDPTIPSIKKNALALLTKEYATQKEAELKIAVDLAAMYPSDLRIQPAIKTVQDIYLQNFFPEMKASWKAYPNSISHKDSAGCLRCHDNQHISTDNQKKVIQATDCKACHIIFAQGKGADLQKTSSTGLAFAHPGGDLDASTKCNDCHNGGPM